jgi:prophage tail gpP-like protein
MLTSSILPGNVFPIRVQDRITIYVDNTPRLIGYVDAIEISYDTNNHYISISGRDKTCDLIDSTLGANVTFNSPITIEQVARSILNTIGLTDVRVINTVNVAPFTQAEVVNAEVGQSGFDVIEQYCRKRQILATTDGAGNLLLTQSSNNTIKTILFNRVLNGCNILQASVSYNWQQRYNKYVCHSQGNDSVLGFPGAEELPDSEGFSGSPSYDSAVRNTRQYNFIAESSSNSDECQLRARWQRDWNKTQSFRYFATVQGHTALLDNIVWTPNLLVTVIDEFADINAQLLTSRVTYTETLNGPTTTIEFVDRNSYKLQSEQEQRDTESQTNQEGDAIIRLPGIDT